MVAVAFDDRTEALVQTAQSLAGSFGLAIRLVHAVEPPVYDTMAVETPAAVTLPVIVQAELERLGREREQQMKALVERLGRQGVDVSSKVMSGDAVRALIDEALAARANLIVVACHPREHRFVPQGFSTALSLMHEAPLPVLVVGEHPVCFETEGFRLILADDLMDGTREAARKTYELAARLREARVRHVHVHGDFREMLRDTWLELRHKIPLADVRSEATPDSIWRDEHEARLEALMNQGQPFRRKAEQAGARIDLDVRSGTVGAELHEAIQEFDPHLLVFGRHRVFKTRPLLIGRMPFKAMIQEQRAVLVVPPTAELHARLPFPGAAL